MPHLTLAILRYQYLRRLNKPRLGGRGIPQENKPCLTAGRLAIDLILAHALRKPRLFLYQAPEYLPSRVEVNRFGQLLKKYLNGTPLAYLVGSQEFMSLVFKVNRHTLIPRPETELLVEETLRLISQCCHKVIKVIDLGTGCGNIAVSLAYWGGRKGLKIFASDISVAALKVARQNAFTHGVSERITFRRGNLFEAFKRMNLAGRIDFIVANPPYVSRADMTVLPESVREYEPSGALYAGQAGTEIQEGIISQAPIYLKPDGYLLMEMGIGQAQSVRSMLEKAGLFRETNIIRDYQKIPRVILARYHPTGSLREPTG